MQTVIMAGGLGSRLYPLTREMPKPMLPVGDQPLLQRIVCQLRDCGIDSIHISTFHCAEAITGYFGDGSEFGVDMHYLVEEEPLGTAGALSLLGEPDEPVLVLNGDILTAIDFRQMVAFHNERGAELTMAVHPYHVQIPYGVIEGDGDRICAMIEKPTHSCMVNAGIYILEPSVRARLIPGQRIMMSDLIDDLLNDGRFVAAFPFDEYWLDIGQHDQYQQAQNDVQHIPASCNASEIPSRRKLLAGALA